MDINERDDELNDMAPKLYQWQQRTQQGDVPKDYFENFEARLQRRLATERALTPTAATAPNWRQQLAQWWSGRWRPALLALTPVVALLIWWANTNPTIVPESVPTFADLSYQELDHYVANNLESFTSQELATVLETEALSLPESSLPTTEEAVPEVEAPSDAAQILDKALEQTDTEDLLDELDLDELDLEELEEEWL